MDLQAGALEDFEERIGTALDRIGELQAGRRVQSDAVFSEPFMADHTAFDSFAAFCEQSPWAIDGRGDVRDVPRERLDDYVAETTDFDTWEGMETCAAEEELVDELVA